MRYTVKSGDTLGSIAQQFGTTWQELQQLNPDITDPDRIYPGQELEVPDGSAPQPEPVQPPPSPSAAQPETVQPSAPPDGGVTVEQLQGIMPNNLTYERAQWILPYLNAALAEFEINTKARVAMFLANVAVETGELQWFQELDNWEGTYLINQPYYPYYGRGLIHLTWEENYQAAGDFLGEDLVNNYERAKDVDVAARIAGWYWTQHGSNLYYDSDGRYPVNLNEFADAGDFDATCYGVNGGWNGYDERVWYYNQALEVLPENLSIGGGLTS